MSTCVPIIAFFEMQDFYGIGLAFYINVAYLSL